MTAWAYCEDCNGEINPPSKINAILGYTECKNCGEKYYHDEYDKASALEDLFERLEAVERAAGIYNDK